MDRCCVDQFYILNGRWRLYFGAKTIVELIPRFYGREDYCCLIQAMQYFGSRRMSEEIKLWWVVAFALRGEAREWWVCWKEWWVSFYPHTLAPLLTSLPRHGSFKRTDFWFKELVPLVESSTLIPEMGHKGAFTLGQEQPHYGERNYMLPKNLKALGLWVLHLYIAHLHFFKQYVASNSSWYPALSWTVFPVHQFVSIIGISDFDLGGFRICVGILWCEDSCRNDSKIWWKGGLLVPDPSNAIFCRMREKMNLAMQYFGTRRMCEKMKL